LRVKKVQGCSWLVPVTTKKPIFGLEITNDEDNRGDLDNADLMPSDSDSSDLHREMLRAQSSSIKILKISTELKKKSPLVRVYT
jgi:hypothetical protein